MKPFEENWQQDSGRKFNVGRDGENQNERKSYNPNFSNDNRSNKSDSPIKKPRKRVGESRFNVADHSSNRPRSNDYQRRSNYDSDPQNSQDNNSHNRSGYNNNYRTNNYNQGGGYNSNREGYNNNRNGGYNNNREGYNNNRNGGYNNNREGGYSNNREGYNNNRQGGYNNNNNQGGGYNRNGYNNNRGGSNNSGRNGYNNQGGDRRNSYNNGGGYQQRNKSNNQRNNTNVNRKPIEYRSIVFDPNEEMRLNKFLANAGVCSRREADELILAGVVTVNDQLVTELGTKILRADKVLIHDQLVSPDKRVYLLLNKPKDCVTTSDDPYAKLTVMDLVRNACRERIYPVGRLDRNTTGVLLLTNDGDLAAKLTHPKYNKKKIYQVTLDRPLEQAEFDKLLQGIMLEDGEIKADDLNYIDERDPRKIGIEIHSGRNRIVRRIFEHLGYRVLRLDRVYFAGLTKKNLKRGQWRFLSEKEVNMLRMGAFE
jgi:23S rRNA pseudouridine2605 synthase